MMKKNSKGQSTLEYAILIIIIIAALLSLNTYVKRGVQGRLRSATDDIGDQFSTGANYYKSTVSISNTYSNNLAGTAMTGKRSEAGAQMTTNVITNVRMTTGDGAEYMP
ncbi:MAG: hypothetical protein HQL20_01325 [Candidatus Omnitrophica bacterium]|nr:hypothetical protein [Candidatus Omnitrophota bacterium]